MQRVLSDVLRELAPRALVDVFGAYDLLLREQACPPGPPSFVSKTLPGDAVVAGIVGFTGDSLRGTVLVASTFELIALARPARLRSQPLSKSSSSDWLMVRDWAGELANLVLGKIKNRLGTYGLAFEVSPPAALSGSALSFAMPKSPSPRHHLFVPTQRSLPGDPKVWFCFDALFDAAHEVSANGDVADEPKDGKIIEFD